MDPRVKRLIDAKLLELQFSLIRLDEVGELDVIDSQALGRERRGAVLGRESEVFRMGLSAAVCPYEALVPILCSSRVA